MNYTYEQAIALLESGEFNSVEEVLNVLKNTSGQVLGAGSSTQFLLYSGRFDGGATSAASVAGAIALSSDNIVQIADSEVGQLANDDLFVKCLGEAISFELFKTKDTSLLTSEQKSTLEYEMYKAYDGRLPNGEFLSSNSVWNIASEKYVTDAIGDFRIVAPSEIQSNSIFIKSELDALLRNSNVKKIDGIPKEVFQNILDTQGLDNLKAFITSNSFTQLYAAGLNSSPDAGDIAKYLTSSYENITKEGLTPAQYDDLAFEISISTDSLKETLKKGSSVAIRATKSFGESIGRHLGPAGIVLGTLITASQAQAAVESGNSHLVKDIWGEFFVATAGSELLGYAAGAIAGLGAIALGIGAAPAVALGVGVAFLGGYYGEETAKDFYRAIHELDVDQKIDLMNRLDKLFFPNGVETVSTAFESAKLSFEDFQVFDETKQEILSKVKTSEAWQYALMELNPFVIEDADYSAHKDNLLDFYNAETGTGSATDEWIDKRASYLLLFKQYWLSGDTDGTLSGPLFFPLPIPGDIHFVDDDKELYVDGVDGGIIDSREIVFHGDHSGVMIGGKGDDHLFGMGGDDIAIGTEGNDYIDGGDGSEDEVTYSNIVDGVRIDLDANVTSDSSGQVGHTVKSKDGTSWKDELYRVEKITLSDADDVINVSELNNESINDLASVDMGAEGEDGDTIDFTNSAKAAVVTGQGEKSVSITTSGDSQSLVVEGAENIIGSSFDDQISASNQSTEISGGEGNDTLSGGDGDDVIDGGIDDDQIMGAGGDDVLTGGEGSDVLNGGSGNDQFVGGAGEDLLVDTEGNDTYITGAGDRILDADGSGQVFNDNGNGEEGFKYTGGELIDEDDSGRYYQNEDSGEIYHWDNDGSLNLSNGTTILNFSNNDLGIRLTGGDDDNPDEPDLNPPRRRDPIVLDLDGDGVETTNRSVHFDLNSDGFRTRTGFASPDDGILSVDLNGNGVIDNGRELFGDSTVLDDGNISLHGFEALAEVDDNNDNVVDKNDAIFSDLRVWQDKNGDGVSTLDEVMTMEEAGVKSINIEHHLDGRINNGNELFYSSTYTSADGETRDTAAVFFSADEYDSFLDIDVEISDAIKKLPQALGSGKVATLHQAMALDETGQLQALVEDFISDDANIGNDEKLNAILFKWVRTDYITDDVRLRAIRTLERFSGSDANTFNVSGLSNQLQSYRDYLNDRMVRYGFLADFFSDDVYDSEDGIWIADDFSGHFQSYFDNLNSVDPAKAAKLQKLFLENALVQSDLPFYYNVELLDGTRLIKDTGDSHTLTGSDQADQIDARGGDDIIDAGKGDDKIFGRSGNDTIYDGAGNDEVIAGNGDDVLYAGAGSDKLRGGQGNDRFIFANGFGHDEISDFGGELDRIEFTGDFSSDKVSFEKQGYNLIVRFTDSTDVLTVNSFFLTNISSIEEFEFADGTIWSADEVWEKTPGTYNKNALRTINGTEENDTLVGDDGVNQTIYGCDGDDTLDGAQGSSDSLIGGAGSDTYLFGRNSGRDLIRENPGDKGIDRIVLEEGITTDDIVVSSTRDGVVLSIIGSNAKLTLQRLNPEFFEIEQIVFSDGTIWDAEHVVKLANTSTDQSDFLVLGNEGNSVDGLAGHDSIKSGIGNDTIHGGEGYDIINAGAGDDSVYGDKGRDRLYGGNGADTLDGGAGRDQLNGGAGNDTYLFGFGDGHDYLQDEGSRQVGWGLMIEVNKIQFKEGVNPENVSFTRSNNDLVVLLKDDQGELTGDRMDVSGWFAGSRTFSVRDFEFADGQTLTHSEVKALTEAPTDGNDYLEGTENGDVIDALDGDDSIYGRAGNDTLSGGLGDDHLYGSTGDDRLIGGDGQDKLYGEAGDDVLAGGKGSDTLQGGQGANTYLYEKGDGLDVLTFDSQSYDTIKFGDGINPADIQLKRRYGTFYLTNAEGDINVQFRNDKFKFVEFSDGTSWNKNDILQKLKTSELIPDDVERVLPALGADLEFRDTVNSIDVYAMSAGFGIARIYDASGDFDVLRFSGEDQAVLQAYRKDQDFYITFTDTDDTVIIEGWYSSPDYPIERIEFSNGVVWEKDQVNRLADNAGVLPAEVSNIISLSEAGEAIGSNRSEEIFGSSGDDVITGNGGNDFIKGGAGNDIYQYSAGFGRDTIDDTSGVNEIVFDASITLDDLAFSRTEKHLFISAADDLIVVSNWFVGAPAISAIRFADDSTLDIADIISAANQGSMLDDFIEGTSGADLIDGGAGNDSLIGQEGADRYHFTGSWGEDNVYEIADGSQNTLSFGDDVLFANLELRHLDDDLIIVDTLTGSSVAVKDQFRLPERLIKGITFADGTTLTLADINAIPLEVTTGADYLYLDENTSVVKVSSDLNFIGGSHGGTTYLIDRTSGSVTVEDLDKNANAVDKIKITDATLTKDDVVIRHKGEFDLEVTIPADNVSVIFKNWKREASLIELIEFADGSTLSQDDMLKLTTVGTANSEVIYGREGDDEITGLEGRDQLFGNEGDDRIIGGADDDTLVGGTGDDTYVFEAGYGHDSIRSGKDEGSDTIEFGASITPDDIDLIRDGSNLLIKTSDSDSVTVQNYFSEEGSALSKITFSDLTWTQEDIKRILTVGTELDDKLYGFDSGDVMTGGMGNDELYGFGGDDEMSGGEGVDQLIGGDGEDTLHGGAGDDTLNGGNDNDVLHGEAGLDHLYGGYGDDVLNGGDDGDELNGGDGKDVLAGDAGNDNLVGGSGNDTLVGGQGEDTLSGGEDNDILTGGTGDDELYGGTGDDRYVFGSGDGSDTISDLKGQMTIELTDLNLSDAIFRRVARNLEITFSTSADTDKLTIENWFNAPDYFARDGIVFVDANDQVLSWSAEDIEKATLLGTSANDLLSGNSKDNIILGAGGDDTLEGLAGNDIYKYQKGDGTDIIIESSGTDEINISGYNQDELIFRREGDDLIILDKASLASQQASGSASSPVELIRVRDQFIYDNEASGRSVESVSIGTTILSYADVMAETLKGTDLDDVIDGYSTDDTVYAGSGDDTINGRSGKNVIYGEAGRDTISGGSGDDELYGGSGNDEITDYSGANTIFGDDGADIINASGVIHGGAGNDTIDGNGTVYGDAGEDIITGSGDLYGGSEKDNISGDGNLYGGTGNDTLIGSGRLDGGEGDDTISGSGTLLGGAGSDTLTGRTMSSDILSGGDGDDTIYASGNDYYNGTDVHNVISGGKGADTIYGSFAADTYQFNLGDGKDLIIETVLAEDHTYPSIRVAQNKLEFGSDISLDDLAFIRRENDLIVEHANGTDQITIQNWFYPYSNNIDLFKIQEFVFSDAQTLTIEDVENRIIYRGTEGKDTLFGVADRSETFELGGGDDYVDAKAGDDVIYGGDGDDQLNGGEGNDLLDGGNGSDKYIYENNSGNDIIRQTGDGNDGIFFSVSGDRLSYARDNDDLVITVDNDANQTVRVENHFLGGDARIDYIVLDSGQVVYADTIENSINASGTGFDQLLTGTESAETLQGSSGKDQIKALGGDDVVFGFSGDDELIGGAGDDTLDGGAGDDVLIGGADDDTYYYRANSGQDVIDNSGGGTDAIFFIGITDTQVSATQDGNDLILQVDGDSQQQVRVKDHYLGADSEIERIGFDNGSGSISVVALSQFLASQPDTGTPDNGNTDNRDPALEVNPADYDQVIDAVSNQTLGSTGKDYIRGYDQDDQIFGFSGNDYLEGNAGDDYLSGGDGSFSGSGDDILVGGAGHDTLVGEDGNDILAGGSGSDDYYIHANNGQDTIIDSEGDQDILFFNDVETARLHWYKDGDDLVVRIDDDEMQQVRVQNHFNGEGIEWVQPVNGESAISAAQIATLVTELQSTPDSGSGSGTDPDTATPDSGVDPADFDQVIDATGEQTLGSNGKDYIRGHAEKDQIFGFAGNDYLLGNGGGDYLSGGNGSFSGSGDDTLIGGDGDDTLVGEDGNDTLIGGAGNDQYLFKANTGQDEIDDSEGGTDWVFFNGIDRDQLHWYRQGDDLLIRIDDDLNNQVAVKDHFLGGDHAIEYVQPGDGGNAISAASISGMVQELPTLASTSGVDKLVQAMSTFDSNKPFDSVSAQQETREDTSIGIANIA
jgi:Ca2+-binding RTX toxin-like protein